MGEKNDPHSTPRYSEGVRDGREGTYNPPTKGIVRDIVEGNSEEDIQDEREYNQGYRHGKNDR